MAVTLARNTTMIRLAAPARATIPFENTRRCPRFVSCRGMKASPAWKLARRGKSAKRRVRREDEDQRGGDLQDEEQQVPERPAPVDALRDLGEDGLALVLHRDHLELLREVGHGEEGRARGSSPSRPGSSGRSAIPACGTPARRSRSPRRPVTAAPPDAKALRTRNAVTAAVPSREAAGCLLRADRVRLQVTRDHLVDARDAGEAETHDEQVGGDGEDPPGLADTAAGSRTRSSTRTPARARSGAGRRAARRS